MKAVIYSRTSSSGYQENRQSTDSQVAVLMEYAKSNNIDVVDVFEEHVSGAKANKDRKVLQECINFVKCNNIDVVLCYSIDRIGRSVLDVFETIKWLADNKVNAYFLDDNRYMLDDDGEISDYMTMIIVLKSLVGKIERNNIKNRLQRGRSYAIANNLCVIGRPKNSTMSREAKEKKYKQPIQLMRKGLAVSNVMKICKADGMKISEPTLWRLKREFCAS